MQKGERFMIYIMLADGFEEIEALAVVDILRRGGLDVQTVSVIDNDYATGSHNITVKTDIKLSDFDYTNCDFIILPGGMPGTINLQKNKRLEKILIEAYKDKKYIAAICAAPIICGELGFLKGKQATCYPSYETHLKGAILSNERVCISDNVITSRGAGTAHDFAFAILSILKDKNTADRTREAMLYDC